MQKIFGEQENFRHILTSPKSQKYTKRGKGQI